MKCLILAAGYATRLYPLTENYPKPLLKVQGKTILDWLIDDVDSVKEIDEYIIVSNHKYIRHFTEWVKGKKQNISLVDDGTMTNEMRLGAVLDIQFAIDKLKIDDDLLVIAGDNVLDFSLTRFIEYAKEKKSSCVMRYFESDEKRLLKSGVLVVDEQDKVLNMTEKSPKPASHWCCPPFYFYKKEDVRLVKQAIQDGCGTDAPGSYLAWLVKQTTVYAMEMVGKRFDIGDLESYDKVNVEYEGIIH
ncbi:MAG: nucleotidyltransferase family protein [Clostridiales bacterium]|nr:nucleotidyltransferase family protein [Clostridiales bacterium]